MNLKPYQIFVNTINAMNIRLKQEGIAPLIYGRTRQGKSIAIMEKENYDEFQKEKNQLMKNIQSSSAWLEMATPYEVDEKIQKICSVIKIPKQQKKEAFLPRNPMFIDVEFDEQDYDIVDKKIIGILLGYRPMVKTIDKQMCGQTIGAFILTEGHTGQIFLDSISCNPTIDKEYQHLKIKQQKLPTTNFVENFVCNLLNFMNNKEVVFVEHTRSEKNNQRRLQQGKIILPTSQEIRVTGLLKKYIDDASSKGGGWHYSFQFPVSAHKRHYKNGKIIKIEQFNKGQGIYIDKKRRVVADENHPDVQRWNEENLDYSDIEPLDEPLRDKKTRGEA